MKNKPIDPVTETIKTYNSIAEEYMKRYLSSPNDKNNMQPVLDIFLSKLTKKINRKVLDIGSGAGFDAKYLFEHKCKVTSIDLSSKFLELARKVVSEVKFIQMDVRKMTFKENSFDGVWASASLLHLPKKDIKNVLLKIKSIMNAKGVFFVALKEGEGESYVINEGTNNLPGARRFFSYYKKNEFNKILLENGFKVTEFESNTNRGNVWLNFFCEKIT